MSSNHGIIYEFSGFRLDPAENLLLNNGTPLSLKPKEFSTLVLLVQNHGNLVERSTLMDSIWGDSFVEEAAVSKCIWSVRNALGDDSKNQMIIQTVPKRGYRFIADVTVSYKVYDTALDEAYISDGENSIIPSVNNPASAIDINNIHTHRSLVRRLAVPAIVFVLVAFSAVGIGSYYARIDAVSAPILSQPFGIQRLSTDGQVHHAVLSPDGNKVYYIRNLGERQSIRSRDLNNGNESEFVPAAKIGYGGLNISPDGKTLFFARGNPGLMPLELFRLSITGGIPQKIADEAQGWTGISPDGSRISFVRCRYLKNDHCSLYISDSGTGENEQVLVTRPAPFRIGASTFTRDGKSVIFANGQSHTGANEFQLNMIEIATGIETLIMPERFFDIKNLAWIEGSNYLLITAVRAPVNSAGIWKVNVNSGDVEELNSGQNDLNNLSLNSSASLGIATTVTEDFHLVVYDVIDGVSHKSLSVGRDAGFVPDGRVVFSSSMSGQPDLWIVDPDGSGLRQLTNDPSKEFSPVVSDDGNFIYYSNNREGDLQLWRMNFDGSNPIQITKRTGGYPISVSKETGRIFYKSPLDRTIWSVPSDGSSEEILQARLDANIVSISPDGKRIAYAENASRATRIVVRPIDADGQQRVVIELSDEEIGGIRWSRDNSTLYYVCKGVGKATIYKQGTNGEPRVGIREIPSARTVKDHGFALSFDEKRVIVSSGDWRRDLMLITGLR